MFCILLDRRNDVKMFKNQVEPRSAGEWFHYKVFNIMTSFLWSLRVHTVENCCRFVFYNDIDSLYVYFCWRFSARKRKTNCATIASFPSSVLLSNKALYQSAREKSLSYCKNFQYVFWKQEFNKPYLIFVCRRSLHVVSRNFINYHPYGSIHENGRHSLLTENHRWCCSKNIGL